MKYDELLDEASDMNLRIIESKMPVASLKGLYINGNIVIDKEIGTNCEKSCVLAEELGHAKYTYGNILDQGNISNIKQEKLARNWAFSKLVPLVKLIAAFGHGCRNRFEICEYLNITEDFLEEALKAYTEKYGAFYQVDDHVIYFEPLGIMEVRKF